MVIVVVKAVPYALCMCPMLMTFVRYMKSGAFLRIKYPVSGIISAVLIRSGHRFFLDGVRTKIQCLDSIVEVHIVSYWIEK